MFLIWQRHLFSETVYSLTSQLQVHNNYNTNTTNTNENITQIQWKTFLVTHVPDMAAAPFLRDRLFWHFSSYNVIHFKHIINTIKIQHKDDNKIWWHMFQIRLHLFAVTVLSDISEQVHNKYNTNTTQVPYFFWWHMFQIRRHLFNPLGDCVVWHFTC